LRSRLARSGPGGPAQPLEVSRLHRHASCLTCATSPHPTPSLAPAPQHRLTLTEIVITRAGILGLRSRLARSGPGGPAQPLEVSRLHRHASCLTCATSPHPTPSLAPAPHHNTLSRLANPRGSRAEIVITRAGILGLRSRLARSGPGGPAQPLEVSRLHRHASCLTCATSPHPTPSLAPAPQHRLTLTEIVITRAGILGLRSRLARSGPGGPAQPLEVSRLHRHASCLTCATSPHPTPSLAPAPQHRLTLTEIVITRAGILGLRSRLARSGPGGPAQPLEVSRLHRHASCLTCATSPHPTPSLAPAPQHRLTLTEIVITRAGILGLRSRLARSGPGGPAQPLEVSRLHRHASCLTCATSPHPTPSLAPAPHHNSHRRAWPTPGGPAQPLTEIVITRAGILGLRSRLARSGPGGPAQPLEVSRLHRHASCLTCATSPHPTPSLAPAPQHRLTLTEIIITRAGILGLRSRLARSGPGGPAQPLEVSRLHRHASCLTCATSPHPTPSLAPAPQHRLTLTEIVITRAGILGLRSRLARSGPGGPAQPLEVSRLHRHASCLTCATSPHPTPSLAPAPQHRLTLTEIVITRAGILGLRSRLARSGPGGPAQPLEVSRLHRHASCLTCATSPHPTPSLAPAPEIIITRAGILGLRSRLARSGPGGPAQPLEVSRLHRHASCLTCATSPHPTPSLAPAPEIIITRAGILGLRSRLARSGPGGPAQPLEVSRLHRHASCLTCATSPHPTPSLAPAPQHRLTLTEIVITRAGILGLRSRLARSGPGGPAQPLEVSRLHRHASCLTCATSPHPTPSLAPAPQHRLTLTEIVITRAGILGLRSRLARSGPGGPAQPLEVSRLHRHASCLTCATSPHPTPSLAPAPEI
jgi:hypothetical protein